MNSLRKIGRNLTALAIAPLSILEEKEKRRRLDERLKHLEQKEKH